jgi:hypothetical protein
MIYITSFLQGGDILDMADFQQAALFAHRFWLQILGDHGRLMFNALSPKATVEIERALFYRSF